MTNTSDRQHENVILMRIKKKSVQGFLSTVAYLMKNFPGFMSDFIVEQEKAVLKIVQGQNRI